jgi:hypothetical protein
MFKSVVLFGGKVWYCLNRVSSVSLNRSKETQILDSHKDEAKELANKEPYSRNCRVLVEKIQRESSQQITKIQRVLLFVVDLFKLII